MNLGPLQETNVTIQLADGPNTSPSGVVEDVFVQIKNFIFPADFYVLDMVEDKSLKAASILLGRLFLKTAQTRIDVYYGVLTMEFNERTICFKIFEAQKHPS